MNISYLFITHDLTTVKAISDKIMIMLEGRIIEQGEEKRNPGTAISGIHR
jgi:peptide/nickel transport system ATP-binding protein